MLSLASGHWNICTLQDTIQKTTTIQTMHRTRSQTQQKLEESGHVLYGVWLCVVRHGVRTSYICVQCEDVSLIAEGQEVLHVCLDLHSSALVTEPHS